MSIAVSVVLRPSRILFACTLGMCAGVLAIGLAISVSAIGEIAMPIRLILAFACMFAAIFAAIHAFRDKKSHLIDISENGQIRLTEDVVGAQPSTASTVLVELMAGSTLWPNLLLLRLQTEDRRTISLRILPDSVDQDGMRALSVALRWIASRPALSETDGLPEQSADT